MRTTPTSTSPLRSNVVLFPCILLLDFSVGFSVHAPLSPVSFRRSTTSVALAEVTVSPIALVDDILTTFADLEENAFSTDSNILERLQELQKHDLETAEQSCLLMENMEDSLTSSCAVNFDWISEGKNALAATSSTAVLDSNATKAIRIAADDIWSSTTGSSSRFTYQYSGNSEAHVSDFHTDTQSGSDAVRALNRVLSETIYPLIRQSFWNESTPLYVYDALVIRYNTTAAQQPAGQPLHRDFGLVSVNFMLNDDFEGGGTFFENQLGSENNTAPIKPMGVGHCLAHPAAQRHAGAGTVSGVRDILVVFVTAHTDLVRNARLKQCRVECTHRETPIESLLCRMHHFRLALDAVPEDGEALQYLGLTLMEYASSALEESESDRRKALLAAVACFEQSANLTPCDARVYNNLGIALSRLGSVASQEIEDAYERGLWLLTESEKSGCAVGADLDSLALNYGLFLSNEDRFSEASVVLAKPALKFRNDIENTRTTQDAFRLLKFCEDQM